MSDVLIRAALDQLLLAVDAIDRGNFEEATARVALGAALRPAVPTRGPGREDPAVAAWRGEIAQLNPGDEYAVANVGAPPRRR